jgi:hypothetical protein
MPAAIPVLAPVTGSPPPAPPEVPWPAEEVGIGAAVVVVLGVPLGVC